MPDCKRKTLKISLFFKNFTILDFKKSDTEKSPEESSTGGKD